MREWLKDYQKLEEDIIYLEFELSRNKKELDRWMYGDLQEVKLNEKSIASNLENTIAAVEYELAHKMNDLYDLKKIISTFKGLDNKILFGKYVEGKTLEGIAEELNYSAQYIYNKHALIKRMIKYKHTIG
ncbi:hypothetical protein J5S49_13450 [Virgibacillus halodenitrificans]|uniref:hypothetical protein n=1 Tax=Virgibacillus halodenitrificans TaxID=1482 RepID=UPI001F33218E|nr:hypothetical protein [Virgibacillus halodenitrificans]MCG1029297.1 hypothetical protein [Virgibacillus halodenitrificans]